MSDTTKDQKAKEQKIEIEPGAWERFERAVDAGVKSGPKPRKAKPTPSKKSGTTKKSG